MFERYILTPYAMLLILGIGLFRGNLSGFLFFAIVCFFLVLRYDNCRYEKRSFIPDGVIKNGLWKNGLRCTLLELVYPFSRKEKPCMSIIPGKKSMDHDLFGGILFVALLLHIYFFILIVFDIANREQLNQVLQTLNTPAQQFLPYWSGGRRLIDDLTTHGYADRVPLFFHATWVSLVSFLLFLFANIWKVMTYRDEFFVLRIGTKKSYENNSVFIKTFYVFIFFVGALFMFFIFINVSLIMLFPGEDPNISSITARKFMFVRGQAYEGHIGLSDIILWDAIMILTVIGLTMEMLRAMYKPSKEKKAWLYELANNNKTVVARKVWRNNDIK
jgi:hypothetical protein